MANLKDIRNRITSVNNTQQITRAMRMVSAAKLRKAQENITQLRPYAKKLLSLIADIAATERIDHPLLMQKDNPKAILTVVMTSDRGLCGGFNSSINRFAEKYYHENKDKYEVFDYIAVGKKTVDHFKSAGIPVVETIINLAKEISYAKAAEVAEKLVEEYKEGNYDEIHFIHNAFISALSQEKSQERLLPIDLAYAEINNEDNRCAVDLIFEPKPTEIIESLLKKHFAVQVYRCMSESVAAEHAARMTAMENATSNAGDMVKDLTLTYNKLRQGAITTELIEISSGAEALKN